MKKSLPTTQTPRTQVRLLWLVSYADAHGGILPLMDLDMQIEFLEAFPEARKGAQVTNYGPWRVPMIARMARLAWKTGGFARRETVGISGMGLRFKHYDIVYERPGFRDK